MPRVPKHELGEVTPRQALIVELAPRVLGGPEARDPYDSARLREASNLVARACTHLGLKANYAVTPGRVPAPHVELAFANLEDMRSLAEVAWPKRDEAILTLLLDEAACGRLLKVAGPPDIKGRDRRRREKEDSQVGTFSLRWSWTGRSARDE